MKIALIGYGKMGKLIDQIILAEKKHTVCCKFSSTQIVTTDQLKCADVAIEFTQPEAAVENIKTCFDAGVPVVCGTTGWWQHLDEIKSYATKTNGALVYAGNFSIGVNIFFELNRKLAAIMNGRKEYQIEIEEIHHTQKKDAPSGTAIWIANEIISASDSLNHWVNQKTNIENVLPIVSKRIDHVTGTHLVKYQSLIDTIEIKHEAHNRNGFAQGALLAAEWICNQKGIHTFSEILHL